MNAKTKACEGARRTTAAQVLTAVNRASATDKIVGIKVRQYRLFRNMTQADLARRLGITQQQFGKYERGADRISASRLQALCGILNISVSDFLDRSDGGLSKDEQEPMPRYMQDFLSKRGSYALMKAFTKIDDPIQRRRVIDLAERFAKNRSD